MSSKNTKDHLNKGQNTKNPVIEVNHLAFAYVEDPVLIDINFTLHGQESLAIYGANGSGKSTLMRLLLGELSAAKNTIYIFGQDVTDKKDWHDVGYVPQMNVTRNVSFPVTPLEMLASCQIRKMGFIKMPGKKHYEVARKTLKRFSLLDYGKVPFTELSGGLQQRTMIARAMLAEPNLLILDEPTAGVDEQNKKDFLQLLNTLKDEDGISYILVTHEKDLVEQMVNIDQAYEIRNGVLENV
ncbi:MAG: metal ABC transporter ATP-binding protein [Saccharofermentanales bacterium]